MAALPSVSSGVTFARCLAVSMLVAGALGAGPTAAQSPSPEPTCIDRVGGRRAASVRHGTRAPSWRGRSGCSGGVSTSGIPPTLPGWSGSLRDALPPT